LKDLWKINGYEISALLNKKEVSATEICNNLIEHIEKINPKINAIVVETFEDAQKRAKIIDQKIKEGENIGTLACSMKSLWRPASTVGLPS